jgi:5,10-methylenetetrahydromethanopterin reductase
MRETIEVMKRLLNMERVTFHGEFHNVEGIELDVIHGRREPRNVPIYIGATQMGMMELAGEIADGVVLNYCVPPEYNHKALQHIEIGAQKAGRHLEDIDRPQLIVCSVDHDHRRAVQAAKVLLTQYIAQQSHIADASGTPPETVNKIQTILGWPATKEQILEAMQHVPDELIERITACGTPDEVRAKVEEYNRNGCTCPILYPLGDDVKLMIDTFAQA